ncbi:MAG: glycosyltransferase family 2 protein [Actinomycetia bacterium]|nr:glycosyltransferase family 2 protein [Actinomycetes bacterium]MCP4086280.1 glycosyltransferase family 2 protein [Actinomycetes bacterium]
MSSLVSFGMPVHNGGDYLELAVRSILGQTYENLEIHIADNASTDNTEEICRVLAAEDSRISYARQERNLGAAANYNSTVDRSGGEYFKWAAHDDIIEPTFVERCVEVLDSEPDVVHAYTGIRYIDADGATIRDSRLGLHSLEADPVARVRTLYQQERTDLDVFWSVFGVFRRSAFDQTLRHGDYNGADQVLLAELAMLGRTHQVAEYLFLRRDHDKASMTAHVSPQERKIWFDADAELSLLFPLWRLYGEHLSSCRRLGGSWPTRLRLMAAAHQLFVTDRWRALAGEIRSVPAQRAEVRRLEQERDTGRSTPTPV